LQEKKVMNEVRTLGALTSWRNRVLENFLWRRAGLQLSTDVHAIGLDAIGHVESVLGQSQNMDVSQTF
jgi:hypothetical protein